MRTLVAILIVALLAGFGTAMAYDLEISVPTPGSTNPLGYDTWLANNNYSQMNWYFEADCQDQPATAEILQVAVKKVGDSPFFTERLDSDMGLGVISKSDTESITIDEDEQIRADLTREQGTPEHLLDALFQATFQQ